jgi:hypothetical protein
MEIKELLHLLSKKTLNAIGREIIEPITREKEELLNLIRGELNGRK